MELRERCELDESAELDGIVRRMVMEFDRRGYVETMLKLWPVVWVPKELREPNQVGTELSPHKNISLGEESGFYDHRISCLCGAYYIVILKGRGGPIPDNCDVKCRNCGTPIREAISMAWHSGDFFNASCGIR